MHSCIFGKVGPSIGRSSSMIFDVVAVIISSMCRCCSSCDALLRGRAIGPSGAALPCSMVVPCSFYISSSSCASSASALRRFGAAGGFILPLGIILAGVVFSGLGLVLLIGSLRLTVAKRALRLCFIGAAASANRLCRMIVSL